MDPYDTSEFSGLSFESEFDAFLRLPANGGTAAGDSGATSASSYHHQGFGQPGGRDNQCPGCAKYKLDLDRMNHDHKINFQLLKKKIINTDLVLRKLKEQKDECDLSRAETEELKRQLDQTRRDSDILSQQLSRAMANIKPLEEEKDCLKTQLDLKSRQVIELNDRIEGDKALKLQRTAQDDYNRNLEIEVTKLKKNNTTLTSKTRSLTSRVKDLAAEKKCLMCSKNVVERRLDNLAVALHEAQEKCQAYWERLRQHDLAAGEKRPNFILSGFKSLVRRAVDKKNGIFTDPSNQTANHVASDDDNVSLHSGTRNDDSDWDNISDVESDDNSVVPQKGVKDTDRPANKDSRLPASNKSAVTSQTQQSPRKQVESDIKALPVLKQISEKKLSQSSAENIPQIQLSELSKHEGSQRLIEDTTCKLSHTKQVVPTAGHLQKPVDSEIGAAPPKDLEMSPKLSETIKIVSEVKKKEHSNSISGRSKSESIESSERKLDQIGRTNLNQKLSETTKLVSEGKKKEHNSSLSDRSIGKSIMSSSIRLDQLDRTNLNQNRKNGAVDSLDDSLSSLSSLSSSDDDSDDANYIDEFLNFGSAISKGKGQSVDLDTVFSFAEIENLLSPLSVSPRPMSSLSSCSMSPLLSHPVSPLLPHPVPLLPLQAVTELSAPTQPAGSLVSSLTDIDSTDEDDTAADCLFANGSVSSDSQSPLHGDDREKIYSSDKPPLNNIQTGAVICAKSALGDGGSPNMTVSRSQSVGFIPATDETGDIRVLDVADISISDSVTSASTLVDVNISEDVSDAITLTDSRVLENVSINATLVDTSDSEHSSNKATVLDHNIPKNICNKTTGTGRRGTDSALDVDTCIEVYVLKSGTPNKIDKLSIHSEVKLGMAGTCDSKSVIEVTQASDMEVDLPQIDQPLNSHVLGLTSPLSQTQQALEKQSLGLKSPLSQMQQSLEKQPLGLKSPSSQTQQTLEKQSLGLKSPLSQTQPSLEKQSLGLKSPLSQTQQSLDTQSLGLKSPLAQINQSLDTQSLNLKSPSSKLSQTQQSLDPQSLDLNSPSSPLPQINQSLELECLDLNSPSSPLPQINQSLEPEYLDLNSPPSPLPQTHQSLDTESIDLRSSSTLSSKHQSINSEASNIKSPTSLPQMHQSVNSLDSNIRSPSLLQVHQSLNMKASNRMSSAIPNILQSLHAETSDIKSPSIVPSVHPSLNTTKLSDINSPSTVTDDHASINTTELSDIKSPSTVTDVHLSLNTTTLSDINSPSTVTDVHLSLNTTELSDIKSPSTVTDVHLSLNTTELSDIKSPSTVTDVHLSLNTTELSDIKSSSTVTDVHPSLNTTELSDIKSPSAVTDVHLSLNTTELSDIKSPSTVTDALNTTELYDIKSPSTVTDVHPSLNTTELSDIKSPSTVTDVHLSLNTTELSAIKSPSTVNDVHPSLNTTELSDIKSPSTVTDVHLSLNTTELSDIKSPSTVTDVHLSLNTTELSDIKSPTTVTDVHPSLKTKTTDIKSPSTVPQAHHPPNTKASNIMSPSTAPHIHPSLDTEPLDINSSSIVPRVHQPSNTIASDIKSAANVPQVHQSLNTKTSGCKSSSPVSEVHQSLNTKASEILCSTSPHIHPSLDTETSGIESSSTLHQSSVQDSDITPPSAELQIHQPANTRDNGIMSSAISHIHPSLNTETLDIKSSLLVQSLSTQDSDIKSSLAVPRVHQLANTKASSEVPHIHPSLDTETSDIKSSSAVPRVHQPANTKAPSAFSHIHPSLDTEMSDIKSSSAELQMHQLPNMKAVDIKSSPIPQVHKSPNTKAANIKSSPVPQVHKSLKTKVSPACPHIHPPLDTETSVIKSTAVHQSLSTHDSEVPSSSVMPQMHQPPKTKASGIKTSPAVPQGLKRKASDIKSSSPVPQALKRKASNIKASSPVSQVHQSLKTKALSAIPHIHPSLDAETSDIKLSSAVPQSLGTQDTNIKSPSILPQRPQSLLLDVFNFFSMPPLLSPLSASPCPRKRSEDMQLIKFKMAAPENIPKVMPCAQVKKQATVGNTSMSAQIIEARKLLAKRKAAALTKPAAVTNGTERKRSSAVAGISPAGPTKRRKLANLSGFPNANAAVMYDLRQFLNAKDLDLKVAAETMLSRVVEGNTKAAWEALCQATISYLDSTNQDVLSHLISACEKEGIIDTVFIREEERRLVLLISAFWRLDESLDRRQLMGKIWTGIFNRGCTNQLVRLSYCRMFTSLCLEQGDLEQVRILVYSIAWCDYLDLVHPLMAIVGVWPQVLAHTYKLRKHSIRNVLGLILREKCKADSSLLQKVTLVFQRVCQFDLSKLEASPDKLLKSLLLQLLNKSKNINKGITEDNTFDTMKTIELLLVYQGPEWTEKYFIQSNLVSISMKWALKKLDNTEFPDLYITCLIRIFRAVIAVQTPSVGTVGAILGLVFPRFLNSTDTDTDMMFTCIDTLLELAPYNPQKSLDVLNKWKATQSSIPAETESKLQAVQSMLSKTVPQKKHYKGRKHKKPK